MVGTLDTVPGSSAPSPPSLPRGDPWWRRPRLWLALMIVAFFAASVYSGVVSYTDLQTQNSTDAGIITQAVASTAHGHVAPFFESYDCMVKARCSFLLVHPSFVLYLAVPFYALASSTITLFVLRAAWVALAAIPLYALTLRVTRSSTKGLIAAGLFLLWAPGLIGDAFSLHLETLLPLELLTLAALWQAGRYRWGMAVAAVTFLTFEIFPLFTFLVGCFFLYPYLQRPLSVRWKRWRQRTTPSAGLRARLGEWLAGIRRTLRFREFRYSLLLIVSSTIAYVVLASFINIWGSSVLGVAAPGVAPGVTGVFTNPSSPATESIATILTSAQTVYTGEYWLLLYALIAFIPLLYPRALIVSLPWIGYTFLTDSDRFTSIGHQYSFIAAGPLFFGLAYGLTRVPIGAWNTPAPAVEADGAPERAIDASSVRRRRWGRAVWTGAIVAVVVANAVLLPVNPLLNDLGVKMGEPFEPDYFDHSLTVSPSYAWMERLVGVVPLGATVAAPAAIFPLIANYPHAYVLVAAKDQTVSNLPFNVSGGPEYLFVDSGSTAMLSPSLLVNATNASIYGLRGYVGSTSQGAVLLYQRGYFGAPQVFGTSIPPVDATYVPGSGLLPGPRGVETDNASSPTGLMIQTTSNVHRTGLVWTGPAAFFPGGNYSIVFHVEVTGAAAGVKPSAPVLHLEVTGFGELALNVTLEYGNFTVGTWTNLSYDIAIARATLNLNLEGFLDDNDVSVAVAAESVTPEIA